MLLLEAEGTCWLALPLGLPLCPALSVAAELLLGSSVLLLLPVPLAQPLALAPLLELGLGEPVALPTLALPLLLPEAQRLKLELGQARELAEEQGLAAALALPALLTVALMRAERDSLPLPLLLPLALLLELSLGLLL